MVTSPLGTVKNVCSMKAGTLFYSHLYPKCLEQKLALNSSSMRSIC